MDAKWYGPMEEVIVLLQFEDHKNVVDITNISETKVSYQYHH